MEVLCFLVFSFFSPHHMYNSNTKSLIIVGAHLIGGKKRIMCNLFLWLIWFILSKNLAFFFHVKIWVSPTRPQPDYFDFFKMTHFLTQPILTHNPTDLIRSFAMSKTRTQPNLSSLKKFEIQDLFSTHDNNAFLGFCALGFWAYKSYILQSSIEI